jgi:hypothetical protein
LQWRGAPCRRSRPPPQRYRPSFLPATTVRRVSWHHP